MTPSEELRAAAKKLREIAAKAVARPEGWESEHADNGRWHAFDDVVVNDDNEAVATTYGPCPWPEAAWIALMSPSVAKPLAALLTEAANDIDANGAHPFKYGWALEISLHILEKQ